MDTDTPADDSPDHDAVGQLTARLDAFEQRQSDAHRSTLWNSVAVSVMCTLVIAFLGWVVVSLSSGSGPVTVDDELDELLRPGPHCYNSAEQMAAARQRALAATDRIRWERDFTRRWAENQRSAVEHPVTMVPENVEAAPPLPPIPDIVGPADAGVPESRDPDLNLDDAVCFGITAPPEA